MKKKLSLPSNKNNNLEDVLFKELQEKREGKNNLKKHLHDFDGKHYNIAAYRQAYRSLVNPLTTSPVEKYRIGAILIHDLNATNRKYIETVVKNLFWFKKYYKQWQKSGQHVNFEDYVFYHVKNLNRKNDYHTINLATPIKYISKTIAGVSLLGYIVGPLGTIFMNHPALWHVFASIGLTFGVRIASSFVWAKAEEAEDDFGWEIEIPKRNIKLKKKVDFYKENLNIEKKIHDAMYSIKCDLEKSLKELPKDEKIVVEKELAEIEAIEKELKDTLDSQISPEFHKKEKG